MNNMISTNNMNRMLIMNNFNNINDMNNIYIICIYVPFNLF